MAGDILWYCENYGIAKMDLNERGLHSELRGIKPR